MTQKNLYLELDPVHTRQKESLSDCDRSWCKQGVTYQCKTEQKAPCHAMIGTYFVTNENSFPASPDYHLRV